MCAKLLQNEGIIRNRLKVSTFIEKAIEISKRMSKQLKKDGFRFVGPTTCFAFMQAVGMINDHAAECFKRVE